MGKKLVFILTIILTIFYVTLILGDGETSGQSIISVSQQYYMSIISNSNANYPVMSVAIFPSKISCEDARLTAQKEFILFQMKHRGRVIDNSMETMCHPIKNTQ